jgi:starch phosphorylase
METKDRISSVPPPPPSYRPGGDEPPRTTTASMRAVQVEDDRTSFDPAALRRGFYDHLRYSKGRQLASATPHDRFHALALAVRDRLCYRWQQTQENYYAEDAKRVYYLSAEFLLGRALANNLFALGLYDKFKTVLAKDGLDIAELLEQEPDAGLGNGGLGRLAACFLDSMATMGLAGYGYGIRYEFGIFQQEIIDGYQVERPDEWLRFGNPWEIVRPEYSVMVHFGGKVESGVDEQGRYVPRWVPGEKVLGVPHDVPVAGYKNDVVNTLRLWQARSSNEFDIQLFNDGDYVRAVEDKNASEVISKVLYPNDQNQAGRDLRLKQEYFFVACSIADIVRRHRSSHTSFDNFPQKNAIQLNDTHPAIAVAELMRVLVDQYKVPWEKAWEITVASIGYTNHTLLAEALEKWPVSMLERLLPRHLQIIYEINRRFLRQVASKYPMDEARIARMSLIEEGPERKVRMAHLAVVGAHAVNGVAALHTELLKREVLPDFAEMFPERFSNKTNGVTPRRWLAHCNPRLAQAITDAVGHGWETDLDRLEGLMPLVGDSAFVDRIRFVKEANKKDLSNFMMQRYDFRADPQSMFDVQIKRLHEYKRQLLNALHVVRLYLDAKRDVDALAVPRTVLFAAKAAPGYKMAKLIIKLINSIADVINADPDLGGRLRVKFLPNYGVSLAERIFPASDLSEQISTAGKEASGTGNMKFAMNGALTIGTLDGANIEIREAVGAENFFLFGLTADEVHAAQRSGAYDPRRIYEENADLKEVLDTIGSGFFERDDPRLFQPIIDSLLSRDEYMVLADYAAYVDCQKRVSAAFLRQSDWHKKALTNVAHMGRFSSDRTIREYARDIWHAEPVPFTLKPYDAP